MGLLYVCFIIIITIIIIIGYSRSKELKVYRDEGLVISAKNVKANRIQPA